MSDLFDHENRPEDEVPTGGEMPPSPPEAPAQEEPPFQQEEAASPPPPPYYPPSPAGWYQTQGQAPGQGQWRQPNPGWQPPTPPPPFQQRPPKQKKSAALRVVGVLGGVILGCGLLFFAGFGVYSLVTSRQATADQDPGAASSSAPTLNENGPSISIEDRPADSASTDASGKLTAQDVARRVLPSVVRITGYAADNVYLQQDGSGIILSSDGYIVTNAHVLEGAGGISVTLNNDETYEAHLVGTDTRTDLAVLKIAAENLTYATFGDSSLLEVGEDVMVIGNPGGSQFAGSVTRGIVSALDRRVLTTSSNYSFLCIQTDAAISPGNSGGPLVNMYGQVVGITSSKMLSQGYEGMGFAIPTQTVKRVTDDLIKYGRVTGRVKLGISAVSIDQYTAAYMGVRPGIQIRSTLAGSDISTKNLQIGDIITHIDDKAVVTLDDVAQVLEDHKPGDKVKLTVYRAPSTGSRREQTMDVTIELVEDTSTETLATQPQQTTPQLPSGGFDDGSGYDYGYGYSDGNGGSSSADDYTLPDDEWLRSWLEQQYN